MNINMPVRGIPVMLRKGIVVLIVLLALYAVTGFFALPAFLRPKLEEKLSLALDREVTIRKVKVNPFVLSVAVEGFTVRGKGGGEEFVSFDRLYLNAQAKSIVRGGPIVQEVRLTGPKVHITRMDAKTYNFSDLLAKKQTEPPAQPRRPLRFSIGNIVIEHGSVDFVDSVARTSHRVDDINLAIPFVSNLDEFLDVFVQPRFSARINGTPFALAGGSKPFKDSLETSLSIDLKGLSLPFYMGYLPQGLGLGVDRGTLDLKAGLSFIQYRGKMPSLSVRGNLAAHDLSMKDREGRPLLTLKEARLDLAPSPLMSRLVNIGTLELVSPEVFVTRDRAGRLNLSSVGSPKKTKAEDEKDSGSPFVVKLDGLTVKEGAVRFTDLSKGSPITLVADGISLDARGLSTKPDARGSFDLSSRVNTRCQVTTNARLSLKPLVCEARIGIEGFEPAWVQPYFTDSIRIAVTRGSVSTNGTLKVEKKGSAKPRVEFAGNVSLTDFASLDKATSDDFLRCRGLTLDTVKAGINPGFIDIASVRIRNLSSRVLVAKDGSVNLASIVKKEEKPKPGPAASPAREEKPVFERIAVRTVVVDNARVLFLDKSVREGYSIELSRLKGTIRGISSSRLARADVNLSGMLDKTAPVLITGTMNPFKENLFVDLHTTLSDLDLSPMSPYSGKYVGYAIEKGKLSLDLSYLIRHKELDSQNNVHIDQFTFGREVQSLTATKLPVRFAVSLLKDSKGRIDLNLPVKGRTDDPEFSVMGIILRMIKNIIVKAATSPFLLLEALYPGASQSNTLIFTPGLSDLPEDAGPKLATLAKILEDKPALNVEIRGYADPEGDSKGLADHLFERMLKAQKLKDLLKRGTSGVSIRDVTITPEEYPIYLKKAYEEEDFPKPRNFIGLAKDLPPAQMEKLMRDHIEVGESDLRLLAVSRARKVQEHLTASLQVQPSRIFLIETEKPAPEPGQDTKGSRVELTLK